MSQSHKAKNYSKKLANSGQRKKEPSHHGSPHSGYLQDEYDFDFDNNEEAEDRFNEDHDESDEGLYKITYKYTNT